MRNVRFSGLRVTYVLAIAILALLVFDGVASASPGDISLHEGYEGGDGTPEDWGAPKQDGLDQIDSIRFLIMILNILGFVLRVVR